jgi:UDP-glucose 4-epimerase
VSEHLGAATGRLRWRLGRRHHPSLSVAVLGGTGLLGAAITRRCLDEGHRVTVLARHHPDERTAALLDGATMVHGDAGDTRALIRALQGATHVVDALGAPHPAASACAPLAQFAAEVPILLGVLDQLRRRPGVSFTYLSSGGAIYGDTATLPVDEDVECNPRSPYGVTKLAAERYVLMAAHVNGLDARILRVANAYGASQRPGMGQGLVANLLAAAASDTPVSVYGDGRAVRDYVDVRDVALAVASLLGSGGPQVLNVGAGVGHRIADVIDLVEQLTGARLVVRHEPRRVSDVEANVLDVSRLGELVPWEPRTLEVGVADAWTQVRAGVAAQSPVPASR